MPPFRYRLATMLRVRENERQRCRQELAEAQRAEERIATIVAQLADELTVLRRHVQQTSRPGRIDIDRLRHAQRYEEQLRTELQSMEETLRAAAEQVERCRQVVVQADRQVRVLEKHRQQQHARHLSAEHRREIKLLDERAIQIAQRAI